MFSEDDLLPISALQHLLFCERQCALIHIEGLWVENRLTVEGRHLHEKAHGRDAGPRGGGLDELRRGHDGEIVRTSRAVQLVSRRLGFFGVADVVEFHGGSATPPAERRNPSPAHESESGAGPASAGDVDCHGGPDNPASPHAPPRPFPIEYKRGRPKSHDADRVQLCAQALCLEEMLSVDVPAGALFYGRTRRREAVAFDVSLRRTTEDAARRLHELIASSRTPLARREPKCKHCSLIHLCLPDSLSSTRSAKRYMRQGIEGALIHTPDAGAATP